MIYWKIFLAFFIPGIVGYGGGPASIPLVQDQVVNRYGWMSVQHFGEVLALGNALPGPISTKMAGFIGYEQGGVLGAIVGFLATVAPSALLMIGLLSLLYKFKDSPQVKRMTLYVRPTIAFLLAVMAYQFFDHAVVNEGWIQTIVLAAASFLLLERFKVHPAIVILGALGYGIVFL